MHNEPFIVITDDDPPTPRPGASGTGYGYEPGTRWGYASGTRWGYRFWEDYERRARQRELRNRKLRRLKELALTLPHAPQFVTFDDPTLPPDLRAWPTLL